MRVFHALQDGKPVVGVGVQMTRNILFSLVDERRRGSFAAVVLVTTSTVYVGLAQHYLAFKTPALFEYAHLPWPPADEAELAASTLQWLRLISAAWHTHLAPEGAELLSSGLLELLAGADLVEVAARGSLLEGD